MQRLHAGVSPTRALHQDKVTCLKTNSLSCTLLAQWDSGYADPWLIVTDLSPQQAQRKLVWYARLD
ncbi:hypothetical protein BJP37_02355 [Moorena bouillonii PNG]|uniref:Uncharacterized protein n=1 Tax=Moorena bouillonii PNG TaxID=568701 RepID=A0A1U7MWM0_9CYAN|nr:hypothetical protein BJP37_02355 [Moorena bouillonii PNG]